MKQKLLELLEEIEKNVNTCCSASMDPEEVLILVEKLREIIEKHGQDTKI
jgi:hypothetical protein